jgi:hypothetical protein
LSIFSISGTDSVVVLLVEEGGPAVTGLLTGILGGIFGRVVDGLTVVVEVLDTETGLTGSGACSTVPSVSFFDWASCSLSLARSFMASMRCL